MQTDIKFESLARLAEFCKMLTLRNFQFECNPAEMIVAVRDYKTDDKMLMYYVKRYGVI